LVLVLALPVPYFFKKPLSLADKGFSINIALIYLPVLN